MIIVKIWGGIGNQIFQYVFGQYLKYKYRTDVLYDDNSYLSIDKLRKRELDALDAEILYDNSCTFSKYKGVKNRVLRLFFKCFQITILYRRVACYLIILNPITYIFFRGIGKMLNIIVG